MKSVGKRIVVFLLLTLLMIPTVAFESGAAEGYSWVGSWSTSPIRDGIMINNTRVTDFLVNTSCRTVVQMTLGGENIRLKLTNRYGGMPVIINAAAVSRTDSNDDSAILEGSTVSVTFNGGKRNAVIPAGEDVYTDPIPMRVSALEYISIDFYVMNFTYISTAGLYGGITYLEQGYAIGDRDFPANSPMQLSVGAITYSTIPWLCNVDVWTDNACSYVFIGDSTITNQAPYYLAEQLQRSGHTKIGILQQAIIGNRLLYDGTTSGSVAGCLYGDSIINRFQKDALEQPGVEKIFVKVGVNDIIHPRTRSMSGTAPIATYEDMIEGYNNLIQRAHAAGKKIYFFSRTAWKGYDRDFGLVAGREPDVVWTQEAQDLTDSLNVWLAANQEIDGYIDLSVLSDPADPTQLLSIYTTDHAHLTDLGARVLVDQIPDWYLDVSGRISIVDLYNRGEGGVKVLTPYGDGNDPTAVTTTAAPTAAPTTKTPQTTRTPATTAGPDYSSYSTTAAATTANRNTATTANQAIPTVLIPVETSGQITVPTVTTPVEVTETTAQEEVLPEPEKKLGSAAKAGIIAGSILLVAGISVLAAYLVAKRNKEESRPPKTFPVYKKPDKSLNSHDNTVVPIAVSPYVMPPEDIGEEREETSREEIEDLKGRYSIYTDRASFEGVGGDIFGDETADFSPDSAVSETPAEDAPAAEDTGDGE